MKKQIECHNCHKVYELVLDENKYNQWKTGTELIQNVFPEMSADDRELLISGVCGTCFDLMFEDEEDEELEDTQGEEE